MSSACMCRNSLESYNLIGKKCKKCQNLFFPSKNICCKCDSSDFCEYEFCGNGEIVTFSVIRTPMSDLDGYENEKFARKVPYVIAIIRLSEGPMLTSEIVDCDESEIFIGKKVEVVFRKIAEKGAV